MRGVVFSACFLAACGFAPGANGTPPDPQPDPTGPDASVEVRTCHATQPDVRLCLDFEDTALVPVIDDNSLGRHDATALLVDSMPRANQHAALVTVGSSITVPEASDLDIAPNVTIEMWLRPNVLGTNPSPLANTGQYALGIQNDKVTCTFGSHTAVSDQQLEIGKWAHVACSYDGTTIKVYFDGDLDACQTASGTIANTNVSGTAIAAGYAGGIDDVHVYARTLDPTQIQTLAGVTSDKITCP